MAVNTPKSRAGSTYTAARGLYVWISDGCSQSVGVHPSIRAAIPSSASRGAVSCSPAYAACSCDPDGSRSTSRFTPSR
ncbi:hypothetical protein JOF29_008594 [Kribbella aluminosa]|uniref:Uncharacterized protein n=1 Tax=Kribbella aluminosa TaxID=416017 RepID=A0ABS4V0P8_9ACTN|nr:hypothetical protein [Kribbella aluminosa]MBP2357484.1 hypothetical protein [Kribbella aluminosa]